MPGGFGRMLGTIVIRGMRGGQVLRSVVDPFLEPTLPAPAEYRARKRFRLQQSRLIIHQQWALTAFLLRAR